MGSLYLFLAVFCGEPRTKNQLDLLGRFATNTNVTDRHAHNPKDKPDRYHGRLNTFRLHKTLTYLKGIRPACKSLVQRRPNDLNQIQRRQLLPNIGGDELA